MREVHNQTIKQKYETLYRRVSKAIETGKFSTYTNAKKQAFYNRLKRYERRLKNWGITVASAAALFLAPIAVSGQATPTGTQFRANTTITNDQKNPSIAMDSDGDFVITWESRDQDGSYYGIYAQRYDNTGATVNSEFLVNTTTLESQMEPSVAMDSDGDFVIAWAGRLGTGYNIYAQRYNNTGATVGTEFQVNTHTATNKRNPSVAMDDNGDFVITWQSFNEDGSENGIYARQYDNAGVSGAVFQVNTHTASEQTYPSVAMDSDGDFIIVWQSRYQDGSGYGIYAKQYSSAGVGGSEFLVNTTTTGNQEEPSVAMDSNGDFIIAWTGNGYPSDIYAKQYNSAGVGGSEFLVNTNTTSNQRYPSAAMDDIGDFVIAWQSRDQDGSSYGIYAKEYSNTGATVGSEFLVNTTTTGNQAEPSVAMDSDGDFTIGWEDLYSYDYGCFCQTGGDGDGSGTYAQRFANAVLPVELTTFTATAQDNQTNLLAWETASEEKNEGFEIERSADGKNWEKLDFVAGHGNTLETQNYTYSDERPITGANYYRLKQVDFDDAFEYSKTVMVEYQIRSTEYSIYPNPVQDKLTITNTENVENIMIYNSLGQVMKSLSIIGREQLIIDVAPLPKGIYTLRLQDKNGTMMTKQFVK